VPVQPSGRWFLPGGWPGWWGAGGSGGCRAGRLRPRGGRVARGCGRRLSRRVIGLISNKIMGLRRGHLTFTRIYGSCVKYLLKVIVSAAALGIATWLVPGIQLLAGSAASKVGTLLVVALIFGIINTVLKPVIHVVGCAFYVLTLGLAALVVNGLLLWLTSVIAGDLKLPFHVNGFVAGVEGALLVGIISWVLHLILGEDGQRLPGRRR
jgi:putative membrane protein